MAQARLNPINKSTLLRQTHHQFKTPLILSIQIKLAVEILGKGSSCGFIAWPVFYELRVGAAKSNSICLTDVVVVKIHISLFLCISIFSSIIQRCHIHCYLSFTKKEMLKPKTKYSLSKCSILIPLFVLYIYNPHAC